MRTYSLIVFLLGISFTSSSIAQELPAMKVLTVENFPAVENFSLINFEPTNPSLSDLAPEIPDLGRFIIRNVNFEKNDTKRQVNINEYLRNEENRIQSRIVELEPPIRIGSGKSSKGATISITGRNDPSSYFNQSFSPNLTNSGTKNAVYRDAGESTGFYYLTRYNPFYRGYSN